MKTIKSRVTDYFIQLKTKGVARKLDSTLSFPIPSDKIKKVLIILPRNLESLDRASNFVQSLKKHYPKWRVELFDVDKLGKNDLNNMQLPKPEVVNKLKAANYNFVLDLNDSNDQVASFITLMTEAPYRMNLNRDGETSYNIAFQPQRADGSIRYESVLQYLSQLITV